jgi:glycerol-3-phosphate dehydrogenase (NAD(P)+)
MFRNVSIIGDGAMGSVCAMLLCEKGARVRLWGYDAAQLKEIEQAGENVRFLPGRKLPEGLCFEPVDSKIMAGADLVISAVPCQFMRRVWRRLKDYVPERLLIVSVAKGIENDTLLRPSQVLTDVLGDSVRCVVLSGPTIADELARRLPATACAACPDNELATQVQQIFGVELAGAMKNVIAIAAGIVDGIGAGDNTKAALLCRGLAEITRLGLAMGAKAETFAGLSGLGDLVTTCISPKGRNRSLGERIGGGATLQEALNATESIAEGVATCRSVVALANLHSIEMPITQAVFEILFKAKSVKKAIQELMSRRLKAE